ncbi:transmembrane protein 39A [Scaptodrosophila lebanonensis]|uniref:Transmembrane protein 39A n=1 Tax=Drosophila lebanonensis TaxID=7225 RepID=A0A6J2T5X0_DROLE|nr:transmembrane protein 39A [Scaptodrosophila lebanonensis]
MVYDERSDGSSSSSDAQETYMRSSKITAGAANNVNSPPSMPKHIPFPDQYATTSEWVSELIMCAFTMGAAIIQFINIYRTNWWLPQSYTRHMVNMQLIDPYLRYLILLVNTRRLLYCVLLQALAKWKCAERQKRMWRLCIKYAFGGLVQLALCFCVLRLYQQHTYLLLFYLSYPVLVYLLIFGFELEPFLRTKFELQGVYINDMPVHCCTTNAAQIRDEIETLRHDFNKRFKQLIFTSMLNGYYSGLVPCFLALSVHYNVLRAAQHCVAVCLCAFSLCAVFLYPAKYSDTLHRATLHLGHWQRLDRDPPTRVEGAAQLITAANALTWSKYAVYGANTVVKHNGGIYRSQGLVTVATPGNSSHVRFYKLFHNPTIIYSTLATLQAAVLLVEIASLSSAKIEWHFVLSISFVAFTSLGAFFKLVRDYLITKHLYKAECATSDRI